MSYPAPYRDLESRGLLSLRLIFGGGDEVAACVQLVSRDAIAVARMAERFGYVIGDGKGHHQECDKRDDDEEFMIECVDMLADRRCGRLHAYLPWPRLTISERNLPGGEQPACERHHREGLPAPETDS